VLAHIAELQDSAEQGKAAILSVSSRPDLCDVRGSTTKKNSRPSRKQ
jgi:hypothetical protein